jgi:nitroreductase
MEFSQVIKTRTSVRKYLTKDILESQLNYILECGHLAPSAGNLQPWEFIIIRDLIQKEKIVQTTYVGNKENSRTHQNWLLNAPVFVVVCANKERVIARYGENNMKRIIYLDCSACIENMLLASVDLNLGSCYISGFRVEELATTLKIPAYLEPIGFIPIGYIDGKIVKRTKRPLSEVLHKEFYRE